MHRKKHTCFNVYIYVDQIKQLNLSVEFARFVNVSSVSLGETYHSQVPDLFHDTRPEGLQGLLGIAAPGSKRICRHPLLSCMERWRGHREGKKTKKRSLLEKKKQSRDVNIQRCSWQRKDTRTPSQSKPGLALPRVLPQCHKHMSYCSL